MTEREMARKKAARATRLRKQRNRRIAVTVCLMLAVCLISIGGTIAWLKDSTGTVTNTFSTSDVTITLEESGATVDNNGDATWSAKMVPGNEIVKDPKVTVVAGSEACWLFVKVTESSNLTDYITYGMASGWTLLDTSTDGYSKVYYREVADLSVEGAENAEFSVIGYQKDGTFVPDKVLVKSDVTKDDMTALNTDNPELPSLTFKAAAVQKANITTVEAAYDQIKGDL